MDSSKRIRFSYSTNKELDILLALVEKHTIVGDWYGYIFFLLNGLIISSSEDSKRETSNKCIQQK